MLTTAMILAAGRGERLRPLTDNCPKAMCMVGHTPLIEYHVIRLAQSGFQRIIINHAYLGGHIRRHLGNGERWHIDIIYSPEPPGGLETGGGIVNALPLLGEQPFLAVNADIFTDFNFANLSLPEGQLAHLVLVEPTNHAPQKDFSLKQNGIVNHQHKQYTYTGIACYHPQLFTNSKPGRYSIVPLLYQAIEQQKVSGNVFAGLWLDTGSPARLQQASTYAAQCPQPSPPG